MRTPDGILGARDVVEVFRLSGDSLCVVAPRMATYTQVRTSRVTLSLYRLGGPFAEEAARRFRPGDLAAMRPLAVLSEDGAAVMDNAPLALRLAPDLTAAGDILALRIHSDDAVEQTALTTWLDSGPLRVEGHIRCFVGGRDQGEDGLVAQLGFAPEQAPAPVPELLLYSPVTQCNLNCIHCISRETRGHVAHLPASVKDQIRAWRREGWIKAVATDYSGDILWADARFGGELDFLFGLDVPLHIDTNGAYLTAAVSERLMGARMESINISLDAAEEETYRRVRKGAPPLAQVTRQIGELVATRRRMRRPDVPISMSFTVMRSNLGQLPAFIRLAADLGVETVYARHLEAYTADLDGESLWHDKAAFNTARAEAIELAAQLSVTLAIGAPMHERPHRDGHQGFCQVPWESAVVLGNGDVQVCCLPRTKIGNLHEQTLPEIWNGPLYRSFRSAVNSDKPPPMCDACPIFRKDNNIHSYLPHRRMASWVSPYDMAARVAAARSGR